MATLVVGSAQHRLGRRAVALELLPDGHVFDGLDEHRVRHVGIAVHGGRERGLVDNGGDGGGRQARGDVRQLGRELVHAVLAGQHDLVEVVLEELDAGGAVGHLDVHLAVKAALAQQCRVDVVLQVRRGEDDNAVGRAGAEAVELRQQLVDRTILFRIHGTAAAATTTTLVAAADGVNLIHKDHARHFLARLGKQLTHALGAAASVHLDEVGTVAAEERHARLPGHGLRQQRLARTRVARQQTTTRHVRAEPRKLLRLFQELDVLLHLLLGLGDANDVVERCALHIGAEVSGGDGVHHVHEITPTAGSFTRGGDRSAHHVPGDA
eukprot:PhM_4_TR739/c0_g1_i1/m.100032